MTEFSDDEPQEPKTATYDVGRGKPPQHSRFKKGKSGNPKGRPKRPRTPKEELTEVAKQKVSAVIDGKARKVSLRHATQIALARKALEGNVPASKEFDRRLRENHISAEDANAPISDPSDRELVRNYLSHYLPQRSDAEPDTRGVPLPFAAADQAATNAAVNDPVGTDGPRAARETSSGNPTNIPPIVAGHTRIPARAACVSRRTVTSVRLRSPSAKDEPREHVQGPPRHPFVRA